MDGQPAGWHIQRFYTPCSSEAPLVPKAIMKHLHRVHLLLLSGTCLLLCVLAIAPVRAGVRHEAEALLNWKASLASADETLGSWSMVNSTGFCRWDYITCDPARHVRELDLSFVSLNGTLEELDFLAFPHLKKLLLVDNGLYGTIPTGIGNLTSLVELQISFNPDLRGPIPHSIGQLKHLAALQLDDLGLGGTLPEEIGNLTSLEELRFDSATLTGSIPCTIGMLMKLRFLSLCDNNLTGTIPMEIGNMTELENMYFGDNYLEGQLPYTISHLRKLEGLDLSYNRLRGHIVADLGNSSLLAMIDIAHNNFSGLFPSSVCVGGELSFAIAGYNGFTSIHPQTFQNCTKLQVIEFTSNNIVANLRDCFGEHPGWLQSMDFSQNQLYGTLLTDLNEVFLSNYTNLHFVDLSNNAFPGGLSKCFLGMPRLTLLDLSSNSLSGAVPFSRTYCGLKYLHLASNHFKGPFPLVLKKCKNLITLDLGSNSFSGTIPFWVSKSLQALKFLRLSSNMFDGIIPHQILHFRQLLLLDLSKNKLVGPVPDDFKNFTGMTQQTNISSINTDESLYPEKIHLVWKNVDYVYDMMLAGMAGIDFSCNSLSQDIPDGITTLLGLRYLNLSGNNLSGCIPKDIGNLILLESLDLSQNQLSGEIPPSFAALKSMSALNLSNNELYGRIPTGSQLQTLVDPSIYSNNSGLCGFPLDDCVNSSTSTQSETSQAGDRETLWLYCFMASGFIFGFWLYWGMLLFYSETWRCAFYQYVDNMQGKVTKKIYSCMSCFQANSNE